MIGLVQVWSQGLRMFIHETLPKSSTSLFTAPPLLKSLVLRLIYRKPVGNHRGVCVGGGSSTPLPGPLLEIESLWHMTRQILMDLGWSKGWKGALEAGGRPEVPST